MALAAREINAAQVTSEFDRIPIDRSTMSADTLNLRERRRTSVLPWRGQFSPELIANLLEHFGEGARSIVDPFAGSGTALLEAGRRGIDASGFDVNPAAVYTARTAELMNVDPDARRQILGEVSDEVTEALAPYRTGDLFSANGQNPGEVPMDVLRGLGGYQSKRDAKTVITNVLMQAFGPDGKTTTSNEVLRSLYRYSAACAELPYSTGDLRVEQGDARNLPLRAGTVDFVITSPPYINVFNYHQNYRCAMELIGHELLTVAKSEIGANRKHRANRFLTVIQYCLDMRLALIECKRVLVPDAALVLIVGRESNVLGCAFENGRALYALGYLTGFELTHRLERVFVSRYGPRVFEDILVFRNAPATPMADVAARDVARWLLQRATARATDSVRGPLTAALGSIDQVAPSPSLVDAIYC